MRILLIKTSSLGDIIHTFPALTDAQSAIPNIRFDWLVEEGFTELPVLHPAVDRVIALPCLGDGFVDALCFNEQRIKLTEDNPEYPACYVSTLTDNQ